MSSLILRDWFLDGEGIRREVISADIQSFLGNDATVRPGKKEVNGKEVSPQAASGRCISLLTPAGQGLLDQSLQNPHNRTTRVATSSSCATANSTTAND